LISTFKKLEDWSLKSADAVITICPDLYDFVNQIITNKEKHFLIENSLFEGVKLINNNGKTQSKQENFQSTNIPDNKRLVVYAGTLEEYQGIDILINSWEYVAKENPNVLLYIIGGTREQVEQFNNLAKKKNLVDYIIFTGRVPQNVAKQYSRIASVLVSPRSSGTNTPLKIYEQIASGIPLVATNIYSHTQVLNDQVAFLVKPEPEDMAKGILMALKDKDLVQQKISNARLLYEEKYSKKIYKNKLTQLFEFLK
jgi:glycosyltransferase involved in cell wall biosynthesis